MRVEWVNNDGGGYAKDVEVRDGITLDEFIREQVGGSVDPEKFTIQVNGKLGRRDQELFNGNSVLFVPRNQKGGTK